MEYGLNFFHGLKNKPKLLSKLGNVSQRVCPYRAARDTHIGWEQTFKKDGCVQNLGVSEVFDFVSKEASKAVDFKWKLDDGKWNQMDHAMGGDIGA